MVCLGAAIMPAYPLHRRCVGLQAVMQAPSASILDMNGYSRRCMEPDSSFACACSFAELLVDAGGVQQLLQVPRSKHTFAGLSFAFFGLSAIPLAFERVVSRTA